MSNEINEKTTSNEITNQVKLHQFIDEHFREIQYAVYGVGLVGAVFVFRSLRVFGQFRKPSSIPKEYFRKNIELHGTVRQINPENGHLMIEHEPIIKLFSKKGRDLLPVTLSGVRYGGLGYQWLDITAKNQAVAFTLLRLKAGGNEIECIVKSNTGFLNKKCLNLEMVKLGMGQVAPMAKEMQNVKPYCTMYRQLLHSESDALRHRNGVWSSLQPAPFYSISWPGVKEMLHRAWKRLTNSHSVAAVKLKS